MSTENVSEKMSNYLAKKSSAELRDLRGVLANQLIESAIPLVDPLERGGILRNSLKCPADGILRLAAIVEGHADSKLANQNQWKVWRSVCRRLGQTDPQLGNFAKTKLRGMIKDNLRDEFVDEHSGQESYGVSAVMDCLFPPKEVQKASKEEKTARSIEILLEMLNG